LPVGISFYTFENLSYTLDVYRGELEPARKFSDYLLFLSFFPKLVMGPIVRANDFVPQINKPYEVSDTDFAKGFYLIISGLFKKLIISDYLTLNFVNYVFDDPARYTGMENLFAVYGYAAVIYCDFSGYSDVAIGIARWLGFSIPTNFLSPYQSSSITEFWRRWHISLSSWLRDYLYIPLGGNRKGSIATFIFTGLFFLCSYFIFSSVFGLSVLFSILLCFVLLMIFIIPSFLSKGNKNIATNFNLLTTMFLGGLWHGASLNFIFWGALHGIGLGLHKIWMMITGEEKIGFKKNKIYKIIAGIITFHFVCFCWIFFKASDFDAATAMIRQIGTNWDWSLWGAFFGNYHTILYMLLLVMMMHLIPDGFIDTLLARFRRIPLVFFVVTFFVFVLVYGYFKSAEQVLPIYLQF
jgi:D-alanyl-lipoteichoic acid acyltransferase DltB (MBOAT superfamily)